MAWSWKALDRRLGHYTFTRPSLDPYCRKSAGRAAWGFRGRAGTASDCAKGRQARTTKAATRAADLAPLITDIRASGATSLRAIARELNARGIAAPRAGNWLAPQVAAVLARATT